MRLTALALALTLALVFGPAEAQSLWPNMLGCWNGLCLSGGSGKPVPPPVCGNLLDYSDGCNSQYVVLFGVP